MNPTDYERELLNREIDGCNSEQESSRLRELMEKDPSARNEMRDLAAVSGILGGLPQMDVPPDLKRLIMDAVRDRRSGETVPAAPVARIAGYRGGPTTLRYLYAFAAGIAAGLIGGPLLVDFIGPLGPATPPGVVGTLAPRVATPSGEILPLHAGDVTGTARFERAPGGLSVILDLHAPASAEVSVSPGSPAATIVGHRWISGTAQGLRITAGEARWTQVGNILLALDVAFADGDEELTLEVATGGARFRVPMRPTGS